MPTPEERMPPAHRHLGPHGGAVARAMAIEATRLFRRDHLSGSCGNPSPGEAPTRVPASYWTGMRATYGASKHRRSGNRQPRRQLMDRVPKWRDCSAWGKDSIVRRLSPEPMQDRVES
jgi:hypothetical protein